MARIRTVRPEFWTSEQVMELTPLARLTFIGLWNFCDDHGVHPASARTLKAELFASDDIPVNDVASFVGELIQQGLVVEYEAESKRYWHVTGWARHQKIDYPTYRHPFPPPSDNAPQGLGDRSEKPHRDLAEDSPNAPQGLGDRSTPERKGKERNKTLAPAGALDQAQQDGFARFWEAYPKKRSRGDAEKAFKKLNPSEQLLATILAAIEQAKTSSDWTKDAGQYIPYPASWLNSKGWMDEIPETTGSAASTDEYGVPL